MKRLVTGIVFAAAVSYGFMDVSAPRAAETTFDFVGLCSDCAGSGRAELVLQNYTLGDIIGAANLVSFEYAGTNLLSPFTITPSQDPYIYGIIDGPFPAGENVIIFSSSDFFESSADGGWCAGLVCGGDMGSGGQWSVASVPEAGAWAMMFLGFAGIGYVGHRVARKAAMKPA